MSKLVEYTLCVCSANCLHVRNTNHPFSHCHPPLAANTFRLLNLLHLLLILNLNQTFGFLSWENPSLKRSEWSTSDWYEVLGMLRMYRHSALHDNRLARAAYQKLHKWHLQPAPSAHVYICVHICAPSAHNFLTSTQRCIKLGQMKNLPPLGPGSFSAALIRASWFSATNIKLFRTKVRNASCPLFFSLAHIRCKRCYHGFSSLWIFWWFHPRPVN